MDFLDCTGEATVPYLSLARSVPRCPLISAGRLLRPHSGLPSPLAASMGENAILFVSYGVAQRLIHDGPKESMPVHKVIVCSLASAFGVSVLLTPVELIKVRAAQTSSAFESLCHRQRFVGPLRLRAV